MKQIEDYQVEKDQKEYDEYIIKFKGEVSQMNGIGKLSKPKTFKEYFGYEPFIINGKMIAIDEKEYDALKEKLETPSSSFGVCVVQRCLKMKYQNAERFINNGVAVGILKRSEIVDHIVNFI